MDNKTLPSFVAINNDGWKRFMIEIHKEDSCDSCSRRNSLPQFGFEKWNDSKKDSNEMNKINRSEHMIELECFSY